MIYRHIAPIMTSSHNYIYVVHGWWKFTSVEKMGNVAKIVFRIFTYPVIRKYIIILEQEDGMKNENQSSIIEKEKNGKVF